MNTTASKEGLKGIIPKVALSPEQFEALSKSMESDESIKALMTKTLNLMIEAAFEIKIGAQKREQTPERKRSPDGTKLYRCGYRTRRFDTTCGTLMLKIPHPITCSINAFVETFRKRSLKDVNFPVLFIDAIFEKVRVKGHATFMAILNSLIHTKN